MEISKFQAFKMQVVNRSDIKGADYNPRIISNQAKERLKKGIATNGLVQPLIWNKRTGNLVGGHQRLSSIDDLEQSHEYSLNVAVVDMSEAQEKRVNVLLNNDSTQGFWDEKKLLDIFKSDEETDYEAFGFSRDQETYFNDMLLAEEQEDSELVKMMADNMGFEADIELSYDENDEEDHNKKLAAKALFEAGVDEMMIDQKPEDWKLKTDEEKKKYDSAREGFKKTDKFTYAVVKISFDSAENKKKFLESYKLPAEKDTFHESEFK